MSDDERRSISDELTPPFGVLGPVVQRAPFVFCSPHSGRIYPRRFLSQSRLDPTTLRKSEDCFVDELFSHVAGLGAPLIAARFPRAYVDVNREPYELDPELFAESLPDYANSQSARVIGGLGTIARVVADGEEIYRERPTLAAAFERIDQLYKPFHSALATLIETTRVRFGYAVLVDCHSMPSVSALHSSSTRPDFVIGDRYGGSCSARLTRIVKETLSGLGYEVHLNRPYAGGFITEHYGRPARGIHAIQLEINRALYMDESTLTQKPGFADMQRVLAHLSARLFTEGPTFLARRAAAE